MKTCKYRCESCGFAWKGRRIILDAQGKQYREKGPGMTVCPKCLSDGPITWVNYDAFAEWYRKNIGDGGCGGVAVT